MKLSLIAICAIAYPAGAYIWAQILLNTRNPNKEYFDDEL